MWLDKNTLDNNYAPVKYNKFIESFDIHNKDFAVIFWNMKKVKRLFDDYPKISKYKNIWHKLPNHIQKCDMARYIILYIFGGLYIDLDFMCFKNLSPLLNKELILVREPIELSGSDKIKISNAFIGSIPGHPFWPDWLEYICLSLRAKFARLPLLLEGTPSNTVFSDVMDTTGPTNFGQFFINSKYKNTELTNTCDIIPLSYSYGEPNKIVAECIHKNNGSNIITGDDYYKYFGNYTHTKWFEGSGWMNEKNNKNSKIIEQLPKNNTYKIVGQPSNNFFDQLKFITLIVIIIVLLYFMF